MGNRRSPNKLDYKFYSHTNNGEQFIELLTPFFHTLEMNIFSVWPQVYLCHFQGFEIQVFLVIIQKGLGLAGLRQ